MNWFNRFRTFHILRKYALPDYEWRQVTQKLPVLNILNSTEKARLRVLSTLLIHNKTFVGAQGLEVTLAMKITIAAQACIEILELGIDAFDGWQEVIIYPSAFKVSRATKDEFGLVHNADKALSGEAWMKGPVILSWDDVERDSFTWRKGHNVVLHEFAHKLDMLNGRANGMPPLHPSMPIKEWTKSLSKGYEKLNRRVDNNYAYIDSYGATNPAEFFAVMCEYFFTEPEALVDNYPAVYQQLKLYFRLDIINRT